MKQIPLSKCKQCTHFNGHICTLEDLDTCRFNQSLRNLTLLKRIKLWLMKKLSNTK